MEKLRDNTPWSVMEAAVHGTEPAGGPRAVSHKIQARQFSCYGSANKQKPCIIV